MKRLSLALMLVLSLGCVGVVHADFWGRLAHAADVNWKTLQKDTTKICDRIKTALLQPPQSGDDSNDNFGQDDKNDKDGAEIESGNTKFKIDRNGIEVHVWGGRDGGI
jgi:hypothetical protein